MMRTSSDRRIEAGMRRRTATPDEVLSGFSIAYGVTKFFALSHEVPIAISRNEHYVKQKPAPVSAASFMPGSGARGSA